MELGVLGPVRLAGGEGGARGMVDGNLVDSHRVAEGAFEPNERRRISFRLGKALKAGGEGGAQVVHATTGGSDHAGEVVRLGPGQRGQGRNVPPGNRREI